ncbi:hypothetical protein JT31_02230 [Cedecea neteri]|uniref:Uncharacterized protein n=1 Tax=Cedecea neteri TaxID=158822 RepID=A0A089PTZ9_9ENTR|nr:hypothetical protein JT31_02230 [Cedecea neteri]
MTGRVSHWQNISHDSKLIITQRYDKISFFLNKNGHPWRSDDISTALRGIIAPYYKLADYDREQTSGNKTR